MDLRQIPTEHLRRIMGLKSRYIRQALGQKIYDEVIRRDNLVITALDEIEEA
jgi:glutamate 5-kinase